MYDLAQISIPTDAVDSAYLRTPQRWDMKLVRTFMVTIGPISSIFDFLTFYVLLHVLHADETLFHTGWFVESLATQTLVLFVIRTTENPLVSRPSTALTVTILTIVAIGLAMPFSPLAPWLGFVELPGAYFVFLVVTVVAYLALVEAAKRRIVHHVTS
jgi:Mg2+-importing ATPase